MNKLSQVLARDLSKDVPKSFRALADHSDVSRTTLQHRAHDWRFKKEKIQSQHYLYSWKAKVLVKFLIQQNALERSVRIKYIRSIVFSLARQQLSTNRSSKSSSKNWSQFFYKRHSELRASKSETLNWNHYDIYNKIVHWFEMIEKILQNSTVLQKNVYNMNETDIMLFKLNFIKVLVDKNNKQGYKDVCVKRTMITVIECVSAVSRYLNLMIIWSATTHRVNWITYLTSEWYYAYFDTEYIDFYISLQWLKLVFDSQIKERANQKPRVLICNDFKTHETLEILEFHFENNITLCRLLSHTLHKLQLCDISVFDSLKTIYRDQVERLERKCVETINKKHFTYLYSFAKTQALTSRNIWAEWTKTDLFLFNSDKVLSDISKSFAELIASKINEIDSYTQDQVLQTLVTSMSAEAVVSLHNLIKQNANVLDEMSKQRIQRHIQKLTNVTQLFFVERALLQKQNRFLIEVNNEVKACRSIKSQNLEKMRVMSYENLEKAWAKRAAKEVAKEIKKTERETKKAEKEAKKTAKETEKVASATAEIEKATANKKNLGRNKTTQKRKSSKEADASESKIKVAWMSEAQIEMNEIASESWRVSVMQMW